MVKIELNTREYSDKNFACNYIELKWPIFLNTTSAKFDWCDVKMADVMSVNSGHFGWCHLEKFRKRCLCIGNQFCILHFHHFCVIYVMGCKRPWYKETWPYTCHCLVICNIISNNPCYKEVHWYQVAICIHWTFTIHGFNSLWYLVTMHHLWSS